MERTGKGNCFSLERETVFGSTLSGVTFRTRPHKEMSWAGEGSKRRTLFISLPGAGTQGALGVQWRRQRITLGNRGREQPLEDRKPHSSVLSAEELGNVFLGTQRPLKRQRGRAATQETRCSMSSKPRRGFAANLVRFVQHRILESDWAEGLRRVTQKTLWRGARSQMSPVSRYRAGHDAECLQPLPAVVVPARPTTRLQSTASLRAPHRPLPNMMPLFQRALPWTRNVHVRSAETRTLLDRLERHLQTLPLRTVQVEHDPSIAVPNAAVLILLCRSLVTNGCQGRDELAFVLTERSKLVRIHRGEISCPGGKVRKGDGSLLQTALRETQEEIGLDPRFVRVLGKFHEYRPLLRSSNFRVLSFIGYMDDRVDPRNLSVNPAEVQNLFVIPRLTLEAFRSDSGCCDWAKDQHEIELGHANDQSSTHDDLHDSVPAQSSSEVPQDRRQRQGGERDVDPTPAPMYCLPREFTGGKIVWGMTARIIHDVLLLIHQCEQQSDSRE